MVTASRKAKQFVWVIVDDNRRGIAVQASKRTFRSMEDAYNAGRAALELLSHQRFGTTTDPTTKQEGK